MMGFSDFVFKGVAKEIFVEMTYFYILIMWFPKYTHVINGIEQYACIVQCQFPGFDNLL